MTVQSNERTSSDRLEYVRTRRDSLCQDVLTSDQAEKFAQIVTETGKFVSNVKTGVERGFKICQDRTVQFFHGEGNISKLSEEDSACVRLFKAAKELSALPQNAEINALSREEETLEQQLQNISKNEGWDVV